MIAAYAERKLYNLPEKCHTSDSTDPSIAQSPEPIQCLSW